MRPRSWPTVLARELKRGMIVYLPDILEDESALVTEVRVGKKSVTLVHHDGEVKLSPDRPVEVMN